MEAWKKLGSIKYPVSLNSCNCSLVKYRSIAEKFFVFLCAESGITLLPKMNILGKHSPFPLYISNWKTLPDGQVALSNPNCRFYPGNSGTYDIEFINDNTSFGIILESNSSGRFAYVRSIEPER